MDKFVPLLAGVLAANLLTILCVYSFTQIAKYESKSPKYNVMLRTNVGLAVMVLMILIVGMNY